MSKTIILPIIAAFAVLYKSLFHVEIGSDVQDAIADIILVGITLYGIYVNHKKDLS
jgi:hypothetical protein